MDSTIIVAILGSSVITALITQSFIKLQADKTIKIENITKERKEWRTFIRDLVDKLKSAYDDNDKKLMRTLEVSLTVRLNPEDPNDLEILSSFKKMYDSWNSSEFEILIDKISYLIKHDWERVKNETSGTINFYSFFTASIVAITSVYFFFLTFEALIEKNNSSYTITTLYFGLWLTAISGFFALLKLVSTKCKHLEYLLCKCTGTPYRTSYRSREKRPKNS